MKNPKRTLFLAVMAAAAGFAVLGAVLGTCDMTYVSNVNSPLLDDGTPNPEYGGNGPYLTISGLPRDTARNNLSDIFLYNRAGKIARCGDYAAILISRTGYSVTAWVPLVYDSNAKERFLESGEFVVTFTANVDVNIQITKTYADLLSAYFTSGAGFVDLSEDWGFFSGGLVNPSDTAVPVVKSGTSFEMNGAYYTVASNTIVDPLFSLDRTSLVYLYAVPKTGGFSFQYSTDTPVFIPEKKGYYQDNSRALYKFIYLKGYGVDYAAKTFVSDPWGHLSFFPVDAHVTATALLEQAYVFPMPLDPIFQSPTSNELLTQTLPPGAYIVVLTGAGGGGGYGGNGGNGGFLSELLLIRDTTTFDLYAGTGGTNLNLIGSLGGGHGGGGTFVYSPDGYFAVAGGGGGAGGENSGHHSGAGGSVGIGNNIFYFISIESNPDRFIYHPIGNKFGYAYDPDSYAAYSEYPYPDEWKNSNGANGHAGATRGQGGDGGNNRNSTRGGGGAGGGARTGYGSPGSLTIYKVADLPF